jgi:hypothetical protein
MKKLTWQKWNAATQSQKTEMYFERAGHSMRTQTAFWNDWRMAFQKFEWNYLE